MAVISIKLKAILNKEQKEKIEKAHILFNSGVKSFEQFLILARGKDYCYKNDAGEEVYRSSEEVQTELRSFITNHTTAINPDECISVLSALPEIVKINGSQISGMLTKLYNKESTAGMNNIAKIVDPVPAWVEGFDISAKKFTDDSIKRAADEWIQSEEGKRAIEPVLNGSGRASGFKKAYTTGKDWYEKFIADQNKYRSDLKDGLSKMLFDLQKLDAFPIVPVPEALIKEQPIWLKLYLKTALENYASYLASDEATRSNYAEVLAVFQNAEHRVNERFTQQFQLLQNFLSSQFFSDKRSVYLTKRMLRGIDSIVIEWSKCNTFEERLNVISLYESSTTKKRMVGDMNFLKWLAKDENQCLLDNGCLSALAEYYEALRNVENKKKCASFTVADPISSMRYISYENELGTNYRKYKLVNQNGRLIISFPLLLLSETGEYYEENITFPLAPSKQFQGPNNSDGKRTAIPVFSNKVNVEFSNGKRIQNSKGDAITTEIFQGIIKGIDIRTELNGEGNVSDVYISMTLDIKEKCPEGFVSFSQNAKNTFAKAYDAKKPKYDDMLSGQTIRALSIDLGLKQFAAAAVGETNYKAGCKGVQEFNIERQFLIKMDGEKCLPFIERNRELAEAQLRDLKHRLRYISFIKRIYNVTDSDMRKKLIRGAANHTADKDKILLYEYLLQEDDALSRKRVLENEYSRAIAEMNEIMKEFRSGIITKKQFRQYGPGKSMWSIMYLEELRKILMAWNSTGYHIDDENILQDKMYGVTATKLLKHINNLKDDRLKTGADLIVQAALGYIYDDNSSCWIKKYDTCNVIVFEDLSRYRFTSDRPKKENSKLMQWSHREIVKEVERQAALYGITVYSSTDAAYSSKFSYQSDAPGIRCDRLKKTDFDEYGCLKKYLRERLCAEYDKIADKLRPGDIIPSEIGSIFVTLSDDDRLIMTNADLNAACNLQKRFWKKHTHLYRIATDNINGVLKIRSKESAQGSEVSGGLRDKGKLLYHFNSLKVMLTSAETLGHFMIVPKEKHINEPMVPEDFSYNLFNDPSGVFFAKKDWIGYKQYWSTVEHEIIERLVELIN